MKRYTRDMIFGTKEQWEEDFFKSHMHKIVHEAEQKFNQEARGKVYVITDMNDRASKALAEALGDVDVIVAPTIGKLTVGNVDAKFAKYIEEHVRR